MDPAPGRIQPRDASFDMTHQCAAETGRNVTSRVEALGQDVLEVVRLAPVVPACVVRGLELAGTTAGHHVTRAAAHALARITAAISYAGAVGHYRAACLRETLLQHVEGLLAAVERMDAAAAKEQWHTLRLNFSTFHRARAAEQRLGLDELAMPLYHLACMTLQGRALGQDFFDTNLVRVPSQLHEFVARHWPRTAAGLREEGAR